VLAVLLQVQRDQLDERGGERDEVVGRVPARAQLLVEGARQDTCGGYAIACHGGGGHQIFGSELVRHGSPRAKRPAFVMQSACRRLVWLIIERPREAIRAAACRSGRGPTNLSAASMRPSFSSRTSVRPAGQSRFRGLRERRPLLRARALVFSFALTRASSSPGSARRTAAAAFAARVTRWCNAFTSSALRVGSVRTARAASRTSSRALCTSSLAAFGMGIPSLDLG